MAEPATRNTRRWFILAVGILAQAATCSFLYGIATLVPALRHDDQLSLVEGSVVVSAPVVGLLFTLIAWGAAADRYGERNVIASGVALAAVFLGIAGLVHGAVALCVLLVLAGAGAASVNAASGRMVMGWFSATERGLAMGARQTAQPLGVAIGALALPPLAARFGAHQALLFPAGLCAISVLIVLIVVLDPPRPAAIAGAAPAGSPYRGESTLWKIHAASSLLVIPQFAVSAFTLVYLVSERNWNPTDAGRLIFFFQLAGAFGRIGSGIWSDRVGSRLRPMRQLALLSAGLMVALAIGAWTGGVWIVVVFGLAAVVTVADNGLAYTSVAELAGSGWAGRVIGVHNTAQNLVATVVPPVVAGIVSGGGYGVAFLVVGLAAIAAVPLTPVRAEHKAPTAQRA
jgi:sugar phosphate permease